MVVTTPTTDGTVPCAVVEAVPCSTSLCCLKLAEEVSLTVVGVVAASQWPSQTVVVNVTPLLTMVVVLVTPGCGWHTVSSHRVVVMVTPPLVMVVVLVTPVVGLHTVSSHRVVVMVTPPLVIVVVLVTTL